MIGKSFSWKSLANLNAYTKLLIHSNTTDGSTTFTDSSLSAHTVIDLGGIEHDTDQKKFGQSSILCGASKFLEIAAHTDFNLGTNQFTADFWVRFSTESGTQGFFRQWSEITSGMSFYKDDSNLVFYAVNGASTLTVSKPWSPSADTWYHIAVVRSAGNVFTLYVNGRSIGSETQSFTIINDTGYFMVGQAYYGSSQAFMYGWIDEFRLVNGKAMWTTNFVPPAGMYS